MRKEREFVCGFCKKEFMSREKKAKFCSKTCSSRFTNFGRKHSKESIEKIKGSLKEYFLKNNPNREYDENDVLRYIKKCKNCETKFLADKDHRKYCSEDCYNVFYKREKKNKMSNRTILKVLRRAFPDWKCPFCDWNKTFNVHHITNKKDGGDDSLMNLVMLCPNHHSEIHHSKNCEISENDLEKYVIGKYYSNKDLADLFYKGKYPNFEIKGD